MLDVQRYDRSLRAIRTAEYKLVRGSDGSRELYDITDEPGEETDIADGEPDHVARLEERLDAWLDSFDHAEASGDVAIESDTQERLENLGYLQ